MELKKLKKILDDHKKWLEGKGGKKANLSESDLRGSNLSGSNLSGSNLRGSNLRGSDLRWSDLSESDLRGSNLSGSDLRWSDLRGSDLSESDLRGSNLRGSDLSGSNLRFHQFPSIRLLSSIQLRRLPDQITLELMRRDAYAHPHANKFNDWAKGGECPYQREERFWYFQEKRELWKPGHPKMRDSDLIIAICKAQGWKIDGYK